MSLQKVTEVESLVLIGSLLYLKPQRGEKILETISVKKSLSKYQRKEKIVEAISGKNFRNLEKEGNLWKQYL